MAALILNSAGLPEPSPEIKRRLLQVHPGLSLRYQPQVAKDFWMVTMDWEPNDSRRAAIREQQVSSDAAWDVIGYLPSDCAPDEAPAYLTRMLRTAPQENIQRLTARIDRFNAGVVQQLTENALNEVFSAGNPSEAAAPTKVTGRRVKHTLKRK